jgi:hypothetical protein
MIYSYMMHLMDIVNLREGKRERERERERGDK